MVLNTKTLASFMYPEYLNYIIKKTAIITKLTYSCRREKRLYATSS